MVIFFSVVNEDEVVICCSISEILYRYCTVHLLDFLFFQYLFAVAQSSRAVHRG